MRLKDEKEIDKNHKYAGKVFRLTEKHKKILKHGDILFRLVKTDIMGVYIVIVHSDKVHNLKNITRFHTVPTHLVEEHIKTGLIEFVEE